MEQALERARSSGADPEWNEFEAEVRAGELLPLRFHVSVTASDADGENFTVDRVNEDVWVSAPNHPPECEEAVREIASKDFGALASDLRKRGVDVSGDVLGGMYVTVALDEALRQLVLEDPAAAAAG